MKDLMNPVTYWVTTCNDNSQPMELCLQLSARPSNVEVLEIFVNIRPIMDFYVKHGIAFNEKEFEIVLGTKYGHYHIQLFTSVIIFGDNIHC